MSQGINKHILEDDIINATENRRPTISKDVKNAKLILQTHSGDSGDCLYDHLTDIIKRVIDERPPNVVDYFEEYSRHIREQKFLDNENQLENTYIEPQRLESARKIFSIITVESILFNIIFIASILFLNKLPLPMDFPFSIEEKVVYEGEDEDKKEPLIKDIMHLQYFWNFAGFQFPQEESYLLSCSIRKLEENPIITNSRFWGKVNGLAKNYFVVEASLTAEEIQKRIENEQKKMDNKNQESYDFKNVDKEENIDPKLVPKQSSQRNIITGLNVPPVILNPRPRVAALPKSYYIPQKEIQSEVIGSGVNRYVYFVCNQPYEDWIELPLLTPTQIIVSRQIKKYLTGNLDSEVKSFPVFPGTEQHYLRAIIARITASTHISPRGYFKIKTENDEEEEEEEEEGAENNDKSIIEDPEYDPLSINDLLEHGSWVHHRPTILKQGRVKWINPKEEKKDEEGGEAEEEEDEELEKIEPEKGPNLMTPCSEDSTLETIPPWTSRLISICNPKNPMVVMRSNLWPGAFSFVMDHVVNNLYLGWGDKFTTRNYSPPQIPQIEEEYPEDSPEVLEINDPTVEEEEILRLAHEMIPNTDIEEEDIEESNEEDDE